MSIFCQGIDAFLVGSESSHDMHTKPHLLYDKLLSATYGWVNNSGEIASTVLSSSIPGLTFIIKSSIQKAEFLTKQPIDDDMYITMVDADRMLISSYSTESDESDIDGNIGISPYIDYKSLRSWATYVNVSHLESFKKKVKQALEMETCKAIKINFIPVKNSLLTSIGVSLSISSIVMTSLLYVFKRKDDMWIINEREIVYKELES
jgi:hypothetical protein